jgi:RNA polymerase sigma-70 factor (ECF subfamily)
VGKIILNIETIFRKYYKELCFISLHYVNNLTEAEDVVQELFVTILSKNNVDEIQNFEAYLRRAVRNASLRYLEKRKNTIPIANEIFDMKDENLSDEEIKQIDHEAELYRHINELPDACKKVFLLCAIDGLKYQEAADKLGISVNTVKTQVKKAYKILRASFGSFLLTMLISKNKKAKSYQQLFFL